MSNLIQFMRRSSTGAPTSLSFGEPAFGDGDNAALYMGRNSGTVVAIAGLPSFYTATVVATSALQPNSYSNGTAGVGATLTASGNAAISVDGIAPSVGQYVLVTAESTATHNGLYVVTQAGDGSHPYILTRASRMQTTDQFVGAYCFITQGSGFGTTLWWCTNSTAPTLNTDNINFSNLNATTNLNVKGSVFIATTTTLPVNTYDNGDGTGAGATLTGNSNGPLASIDGQTASVGQRILVKNESAGANNGIYVLTQLGSIGGSLPYILTRTTDFDNTNQVVGAVVFVEAGTANATTAWAVTNTTLPSIGSTTITFTQFAGSTTYTSGTGINVSGTVINLVVPVSIANGGTNATSAGAALTSLGAAANGTNNDIMSMTGLTGYLQAPSGVKDSSGNKVQDWIKTTSAVNWIQVTNQITGTAPSITSTGSDTDVSLNLITKGAGVVKANGVQVLDTSSTISGGTY